MALADPQSITVNAVAQSMPRISSTSSGNSRRSNYQKSDRTYSLEVLYRDTTKNKKQRTVCLLTFIHTITATDPFTAEQYSEDQRWSIQLDRPLVGFTQTQADQDWAGLKAWLDSTMVGKIWGGES